MDTNTCKQWAKSASIAVAILAATGSASQAGAAILDLSGTRSNVTPVVGAPGGRCSPAITVSMSPNNLSASGTSNLGGFEFVASHCIAGRPPGPYYDGIFDWQFAGGNLLGTYSGVLTDSGTPGVFDLVESILFTGGTGQFLGASGHAAGTGTVAFGQRDGVAVTIGNIDFAGRLDAPAVPEPATWAMMIVGFGTVGFAMRARRAPHIRVAIS